MATSTNLDKVHVFKSEDSYEQNKQNVGQNDLAFVPIPNATTQEAGLVVLANDDDLKNEAKAKPATVNNIYRLNDFRKMGFAYEVGDKVACAFEYEYYLECIEAGTTSEVTLDTENVTYGQEITDGTCKWIVRSRLSTINGKMPDADGNFKDYQSVNGKVNELTDTGRYHLTNADMTDESYPVHSFVDVKVTDGNVPEALSCAIGTAKRAINGLHISVVEGTEDSEIVDVEGSQASNKYLKTKENTSAYNNFKLKLIDTGSDNDDGLSIFNAELWNAEEVLQFTANSVTTVTEIIANENFSSIFEAASSDALEAGDYILTGGIDNTYKKKPTVITYLDNTQLDKQENVTGKATDNAYITFIAPSDSYYEVNEYPLTATSEQTEYVQEVYDTHNNNQRFRTGKKTGSSVEWNDWKEVVTKDWLKNNLMQLSLDVFFPVGSIYMSANSDFDPNTSFGGTWSKIENRFLYGSGSKSMGATGGAETVKLTEAQMPAHSHSRGNMNITGQINIWAGCDSASGVMTGTNQNNNGAHTDGGYYRTQPLKITGSSNWSGCTGSKGSGSAHENMPPYVVVAIWKRTA